jgi:hypothetical protein
LLTSGVSHAHDDGMRRILASLKYVPAVVCVLLVVAWVVSIRAAVGIYLPLAFSAGHGMFGANVDFGSLLFEYHEHRWDGPITFKPLGGNGPAHLPQKGAPSCFGEWWFGSYLSEAALCCPIPFVLAALLPFAVGLATDFRYQLWMWFVWAGFFALVCVHTDW